MKNRVFTLAVMLTVLAAAAHAGQPKPNKNAPPGPAGPKGEEASIVVTGMM